MTKKSIEKYLKIGESNLKIDDLHNEYKHLMSPNLQAFMSIVINALQSPPFEISDGTMRTSKACYFSRIAIGKENIEVAVKALMVHLEKYEPYMVGVLCPLSVLSLALSSVGMERYAVFCFPHLLEEGYELYREEIKATKSLVATVEGGIGTLTFGEK